MSPPASSRWTSGLEDARALVWRRRSSFGLGLLLLLVNRLAALVLPASSRHLVDGVAGEGRTELLGPIALAIGVAALVQAATTFGLTRVLAIAAQRTIVELRRRIDAHVLRLPIQYFEATPSGVIAARVLADAELVRDLIGSGLVHFGGSTLSALFAMAYLFFLDPGLTAALLVIVIPFAAGFAWSFRRLRPLYDQNAAIRAGLHGRLFETIGGIRVVKTYTAEKREERAFARGAHRLFRNLADSHMLWSANTAMSALATGAIGVLLTLLGGRALVTGAMTTGEFLTYVLFLALAVGPLEHVVTMGPHVAEALSALARIRQVLDQPIEGAGDAGLSPQGDVRGAVALERVSHEYQPGLPVLDDVDLVVPAGSTVALVGPSGAGKSTLIHLVMGFARPTRGRVLVDGRDLVTIPIRDHRSHLGVVLQETFLFDGTIADNIRYGRPGASDEAMREACALAHVDEFADRLPLRYETLVGERGIRLSGGQRQRIAIARALLAQPRILILDEATSSLDGETEALIQDGLRALRAGRTTFVIAHRLSTVRGADQIVVLDRGRIVGRGTHLELLARNEPYRRLYERQRAIAEDRFVNPGEELAAEA